MWSILELPETRADPARSDHDADLVASATAPEAVEEFCELPSTVGTAARRRAEDSAIHVLGLQVP